MTAEQYKILVVDDEIGVAKITGTTISSLFDCEIIVCTEPVRAMEIVAEEEIAVLLCDFQMPQASGLDVMERAHACNPNTVAIMITALATKDLMIKTLNSGYVWRCIEKPWRAEELVKLVDTALNMYKNKTRQQAAAAAPAVEAAAPPPPPEPEPEPEPEPAPGPERNRIVIRKASISGGAGRRPRGSASRALRKRLSKGKAQIRIRPAGSKGKPDHATVSAARVKDSRYQDLELIAEGGSGSIYKATDSLLGMPVAIKILSDTLGRDKVYMAELFDEARIAMQLSHKHIVRLHNIHEEDGAYYLVMEYIEGCTLRDVLDRDGLLNTDTVLQLVEICADALGYAHRRQVYHRDLKPDNLMLTNEGVLKIIDFGLACLAERTRNLAEICGTPYYVSPEEIAAKPLDQRTDIYSFGIMIHEFLTGEIPFAEGQENCDMLSFVPQASRDLPLPVQQVMQKSFAADPAERWNEIDDFADAFRAAWEAARIA